MRYMLCAGLLISAVLVAGCWDRVEINDLAIVAGTALDLTDEGDIRGSVQIALPQQAGATNGGRGRGDKFFVISATGKSNLEVIRKLQQKLSRKLFTSHRSVIFVSERLARRGLDDSLDIFTHDPHNRLRTYIMVVRGGKSENILQVRYPFEEDPTEAVKEMELLEGGLAVNLRDFFIASTSEGINPVTSIIRRDEPKGEQSGKEVFTLAGAAVFKKLKMVGLLDDKETEGLLWMKGRMKMGRITASLPDGGGHVGMQVIKAGRHVGCRVAGDDVTCLIRLSGEGSLFENMTTLDVNRLENIKRVEQALEQSVEARANECLAKLQKRYKTDAIGLGREIYRSQPERWKKLKDRWDAEFPNVKVKVAADLTLRESGVSGEPLQLNEKEIVK